MVSSYSEKQKLLKNICNTKSLPRVSDSTVAGSLVWASFPQLNWSVSYMQPSWSGSASQQYSLLYTWGGSSWSFQGLPKNTESFISWFLKSYPERWTVSYQKNHVVTQHTHIYTIHTHRKSLVKAVKHSPGNSHKQEDERIHSSQHPALVGSWGRKRVS